MQGKYRSAFPEGASVQQNVSVMAWCIRPNKKLSSLHVRCSGTSGVVGPCHSYRHLQVPPNWPRPIHRRWASCVN